MARERVAGGEVRVGDARLPVEIHINPRARRLILRVARGRTVRVTCPSRKNVAEAMAMVRSRTDWIAARLAETPPQVPFTHGTTLPVLGQDRQIVWEQGFAAARLDEAEIRAGGADEAALARRIERLLRKTVNEQLRADVADFAHALGVVVGPIGVRQMSSRWGSCSVTGQLSFNWRLVFAPPFVRRYVAAHEVAHRKHMDHSPAFWAVVERLDPDYARAAAWLRQNGARLHAYGVDGAGG